MVVKRLGAAILAMTVSVGVVALAVEEIPAHQQKQIRDATPEKPRAAPKKARRVLMTRTL